MFLGKINQSNNKKLILVLESIKCGGIDELITNLFSLDNKNRGLLSSQSDFSSTKLDFLLYRITRPITSSPDISNCFKGLSFTESLLKSESSTFIIDVCKYNYAKISQNIAQLLPSPHVGKPYNIRKCYHRHLQEGINADAVSGWLLYASFYYVIGQYNVTLTVADYVLSKFTPNMVLLNCIFYGREKIDYYRQNVHSAMTLKEKIKSATVGYIWYMKHSSLIPKELQLEVEDADISIPPVVMSHCLRFLCYHHLDDIFNRQQALRELHNTIKYRYFIARNSLSCALTILGVCYEISGDKDIAYRCYDQAVCSNEKCHTAEKKGDANCLKPYTIFIVDKVLLTSPPNGL
ncbi:unnamed protein product [Mytilus coruscus]|uniref:Uncharacterized protein n=1 Tax=Mytilus coruscus TaxID=42192 RepID=A0A6J8BEG4_MYTCO|nr:unnamed protein product [Mytilus coruscus]